MDQTQLGAVMSAGRFHLQSPQLATTRLSNPHHVLLAEFRPLVRLRSPCLFVVLYAHATLHPL